MIPLPPQPEWMADAACREIFPDMFHPSPGDRHGAEEAKAFCRASCSVIATCLQWAHDTGDQHAILGGTTPEERRRARRGKAS